MDAPEQYTVVQPAPMPEQPVAMPEQPVAMPEQPITMPEQPITMPEQPITMPEQPITMPSQPELVIIRGLPGTGKSTAAREEYPGHLHYEPDHYFCDTRGRYRFDAQLWDRACDWCATMADFALARGENVVISDVFARLNELRPYRILAEAHGASFKVITLTEQRRNVHKVPVTILQRMAREFEEDSA